MYLNSQYKLTIKNFLIHKYVYFSNYKEEIALFLFKSMHFSIRIQKDTVYVNRFLTDRVMLQSK